MLSVGQKMGQWTVLAEAPKRGKHRYFKCKCDCGTVREVKSTNVTMGISRSCGHDLNRKHGLAMSRIFEKDPPVAIA